MIRQFTIRIIDAQCKEHEFGPVALDVPENDLIGWGAVAADEAEAVKAAKADMTAAVYVPELCPGPAVNESMINVRYQWHWDRLSLWKEYDYANTRLGSGSIRVFTLWPKFLWWRLADWMGL